MFFVRTSFSDFEFHTFTVSDLYKNTILDLILFNDCFINKLSVKVGA